MSVKDTKVLNDVITGRAEPNIYAFITNTVPNYLKVGDTERHIGCRMAEWKKIFPNLELKYNESAMVSSDVFFRDFSVHDYLEKDLGKKRLMQDELPNNVYFSREFFYDTSIKDVENAIKDIKRDFNENFGRYQFYKANHLPITYVYSSTGFWTLRPNQKKVVENFKKAIENNRNNLLMYAVMRFGKTFVSMCCANEMTPKADVVLIVSAKADVKEEWKKTIQSADNFKDFVFLCSDDLVADSSIYENFVGKGKRIAVFLTLQDLQGKQIKEKHHELFEHEIDLLIVDETHFGARADKYGAVIKQESIKDIAEKREDDFIDLDNAEKQVKKINAKVRLHLSGTPYRILMGDEFKKDDVIAFVQFSDIYNAKLQWDEENLKNDEPKNEWENPYYGFPQMIRFAFQPNESSRKKMEELKASGVSCNFSDLFEPRSIHFSNGGFHKKFKHEQEVLDFLMTIDGSKDDDELFGFLNYERIKKGNMCHHMVFVLPYRASCDALEFLLKKHADKFKNLSSYAIVNISGVDNDKQYSGVEDVKQKIKDCENQGIHTITLTVNRMLTGSTVPEWDTMIYLKDSSSPQEYDQAIYRIQSQFIKEFRAKDDSLIKVDMKPQTLLVDLNPNRMFAMQESKSLIYNVNVEKHGNSKLSERLQKELQISPIFVVNKDKIKEVQPIDIMNSISEYSKNKGVIDETNDIPVDMALLEDPSIRKIIERQAEITSNKGIFIPTVDTDGEGDDIVIDQLPSEKKTKNKELDTTDSTKSDYQRSLVLKFKSYYAKILFYAFLTKTRIKSLEEIVSSYSINTDNSRIFNSLSIDIEALKIIRDNMDAFKLSQLDNKIMNLNQLANDESINPMERVMTAIKKFDKLSDSQVVTPQETCSRMIDCINADEWKAIIKGKQPILDIASKKGEFAVAIYTKLINEGIATKDEMFNLIYSIPTSRVAYEFTRKIYEILNLNVENIEFKFTTYNLINGENVLEDNLLFSGGNKDMKFSVIVGNPPYHEKDGGAGASATPIYGEFVDIARRLEPDFISMIIPTRWYLAGKGGKAMDDFRLSILDDPHFRYLQDVMTPDDIFPNTNNRGGVCFFLWDKQYNQLRNNLRVLSQINGKIVADVYRPFKMFKDEPYFIRDYEGKTIIDKVRSKSFAPFSKWVSSRKPFDIEKKYISGSKVSKNKTALKTVACYIKGQKIVYTARKDIPGGTDMIDSWKVLIPRANNIGTELNDDNLNSFVGGPNFVCSESYVLVAKDDKMTESEAENLANYMKTRFFRYMHGLLKISQDATAKTFSYVPQIDISSNSQINWKLSLDEIDEELFNFYELDIREREHIKSRIKPMH